MNPGPALAAVAAVAAADPARVELVRWSGYGFLASAALYALWRHFRDR